MLLRWIRPHVEFVWTDLEGENRSRSLYRDQDGSTAYYVLPERLYGIWHVVMALIQILHEMAEHAWLTSTAAFSMDTHYRLVRSDGPDSRVSAIWT